MAELGLPRRPQPLSHLVAIVVHGHQAVEVEDVVALDQLSHEVRFDSRLGPLVARGGREAFHADGAVLCQREGQPSEGWAALLSPRAQHPPLGRAVTLQGTGWWDIPTRGTGCVPSHSSQGKAHPRAKPIPGKAPRDTHSHLIRRMPHFLQVFLQHLLRGFT